MKLNYIDVLYLAATHKKWPVHGKKQISEALLKVARLYAQARALDKTIAVLCKKTLIALLKKQQTD